MRDEMTLNKINVTDTINQARKMLKDNPKIPSEFAAVVLVLLTLLEVLLMRFGKNSKNSSIPPSQDPNRDKGKKPGETGRKPGGQKGREAKILKPFDNPDEIIQVPVNRENLPQGHTYNTVGHTKRQVIEIIIKRHVKEYQLEIVTDENGKRYTAETVDGASRPVQYGNSIKSMIVYMSLYQMIPYLSLIHI
jgi:transposase